MGFLSDLTKPRHTTRLEGVTLTNTIIAVSSVGFSLFGYDQGVMANLIGADNEFGKTFGHPDAGLQGTIVAIYELTAFVGSIAVIFMGDWLGRRRTLNWGIYTQLLGVIIQCSAYDVAQLIVGRCITGIGIGILTAGVPVLQAECCAPHDRGRNACWFNWICIVGVTSAYWIGYGSSYIDNQAQWRFPVAFQACFSLAVLILIWLLPESPRWLIYHYH